MKVDKAKRLKEGEKENARHRKLVADLSLDNAILEIGQQRKLLSPAMRRRAVEQVINAVRFPTVAL
ncbi:MAG: hypothetical protein EG822_07520 [Deltaproteobacteria bacterium]|nr:hypothetical protein [Deltaproteobacteria bacterium]TLN04626.1 MAG: hypothetical protein FDZ73_02540 [bacterium]